MTPIERDHVRHIAKLARKTRIDLSQNAANGASARPTFAQFNAALDRLAEIENSALHALAASLSSALP